MTYKLKREGAMHQVVCASSGRVQFQSLRRINCTDWIANNTPKEKPDEHEAA